MNVRPEDLLHVFHVIPIVAAYGALGTVLFPTIVERLDLSHDRQFAPQLRWSARLFFLGCATFHLVIFGAVLASSTIDPWEHAIMHATAIPQAIGGPAFVHYVLKSSRHRQPS